MGKELLLGSSGFVGSNYLLYEPNFYAPNSSQINIGSKESIIKFLLNYPHIKAVINFAAYTNTKDAQNQVGDVKSPAWTVNVDGAKNVSEACYEKGVFLIFISTDSVFFGKIGPSDETEKTNNDGLIDWYGHTKLKGEEEVIKSKTKYAIVRIAYPFGDPKNTRDYCQKIITTIKKGYPLFNDQFFTPTYLPQAFEVIKKLSETQMSGIFHAVCTGITTPYQIGLYLNKKLNLQLTVKEGSLKDYEKINGKQSFASQGGLATKQTSELLAINFISWEEALDKYCENYQRNLPQIQK